MDTTNKEDYYKTKLVPNRMIWYSNIEFTSSLGVRKIVLPSEYFVKSVSSGYGTIAVRLVSLADPNVVDYVYRSYKSPDLEFLFSSSYDEAVDKYNSVIDEKIEYLENLNVVGYLENSFKDCDLTKLPEECTALKLDEIKDRDKRRPAYAFIYNRRMIGVTMPISVSKFPSHYCYYSNKSIDVSSGYGIQNIVPISDYGKNAITTFYPSIPDLYLAYSNDPDGAVEYIKKRADKVIEKLRKIKI